MLGHFREPAHSPGRENDDELILRATASALEDHGFATRLCWPDEAGEAFRDQSPRIFMMCEQPAILADLRRAEARGAILVNSPEAIAATYRDKMAAALRHAHVPFPRYRFLPTDAAVAPAGPLWVKRGDVHNVEAGDVVFVAAGEDPRQVLQGMASRGIAQAMLQHHVAGDLIKFYGVGDRFESSGGPFWFRWFYHQDQELKRHPFDELALKGIAFRAAGALGLEVFGGDAIATGDGELYIIDINAWPSFARFRDEAAREIATHLSHRFMARDAASTVDFPGVAR